MKKCIKLSIIIVVSLLVSVCDAGTIKIINNTSKFLQLRSADNLNHCVDIVGRISPHAQAIFGEISYKVKINFTRIDTKSYYWIMEYFPTIDRRANGEESSIKIRLTHDNEDVILTVEEYDLNHLKGDFIADKFRRIFIGKMTNVENAEEAFDPESKATI